MTADEKDYEERLSSLSPPQRALLLRRLRRQAREASRPQGIPKRAHEGPVPLSADQERLWLIDQLAPGTAAFNLNAACTLSGPLDAAGFFRSVEAIVRRHESLRTTFTDVGGWLAQVIHPEMAIPLSVEDLTGVPLAERPARIERRLEEAAWFPFDLRRGPLLRVTLLRTDVHRYALLVTIHHIVADHVSFAVFGRELAALYSALSSGQPPGLPALPIQYGDFAAWQRGNLTGEGFERLAAYWRERLQGAPLAIELPFDHPRPAIQTFKGTNRAFELPMSVRVAFKELAREEAASPFMLYLAAFAVLLYRHSGQPDLVIGAPMANRLRRGTEGLIGYLLNLLPVRIDLGGPRTFREALREVRTAALGAYSHAEMPFSTLVQLISAERHLSHSPLFQTCLVYLDAEGPLVTIPGLTTNPLILKKQGSRLDLTLAVWESPEGLGAFFEYNTDLWEAATIDWMIEHLQNLLERVAGDPDQRISSVALVGDRARREPSGRKSPVVAPAPLVASRRDDDSTLSGRFEEQARRFPEQVAVQTDEHCWTYSQLSAEAERVRLLLGRRGWPEHVALLFDQGAPMIAAILGTLGAGSTYVPLDASDPELRLADFLRESGAKVILTDAQNAGLAKGLAADGCRVIDFAQPDEGAAPPGGPRASPDSLAYFLYTSGSSGRPKGVMQSHGNVLHHIQTYIEALRISAKDRLTLLSSYAFDAAVMDIFASLLSGATLCPFDVRRQGLGGLRRHLIEGGVSIYHSTPTLFRVFAESLGGETAIHGVRLVVLGGEEATRRDVELFERCFPRESLLINGFGPSESTLALQYFVDRATSLTRDSVPIGYPVAGTEVFLLDENGERTSPFGEIAIRGPHLAAGYWGRPDLTASGFVPDPDGDGARIHRTGDLGRLLPDGSLEFVGRKDRQIKVRGFRVDTSEVESALASHVGIAQCAVVAQKEALATGQLVAYVVPRSRPAPSPRELRSFLGERLPGYMVPASWVTLDALPFTANGKLDRPRLPKADPSNPGSVMGGLAPRTQLERELATIWTEVLAVSPLGVDDDFLALGGHSLTATQILSRVRDAFGVELPFRTLFENATIAGLAERVAAALAQPD